MSIRAAKWGFFPFCSSDKLQYVHYYEMQNFATDSESVGKSAPFEKLSLVTSQWVLLVCVSSKNDFQIGFTACKTISGATGEEAEGTGHTPEPPPTWFHLFYILGYHVKTVFGKQDLLPGVKTEDLCIMTTQWNKAHSRGTLKQKATARICFLWCNLYHQVRLFCLLLLC